MHSSPVVSHARLTIIVGSCPVRESQVTADFRDVAAAFIGRSDSMLPVSSPRERRRFAYTSRSSTLKVRPDKSGRFLGV